MPARTTTLRRLAATTIVATIGVGAGFLALQLLGDRVGRWVTAAQAISPWLIPPSLFAAALACWMSLHRTAVVGAIVSAGYLVLTMPLAFPQGLPPANGETITVLHANLQYSNAEIGTTIVELAAAEADVLAVSELTPEHAGAIDRSVIGQRYPHRLLRPGTGAVGLGLWSRRPLTPVEVAATTMALAVEVEVAGRPLRVLVAHPLPPLFNAAHWTQEMSALAADAVAHDGTIVVADLNVSHYHPAYRRWLDATGYRDVHQAFGAGFSFSWPTDATVPPFVRIDHALVDATTTATAIDDHRLTGSDHMAFTVQVGWAAPPRSSG